jgi:hypothetical protein
MVDGKIFRIAARAGAKPENISARLGFLGNGEDKSVNVAKAGTWMILETTRPAPCQSWECLTLVRGDLKDGTVVSVDGDPVHARGRAAVHGDGAVIVYTSDDGPHDVDLFVLRRSRTTWGPPVLLTKDSTEKFNIMPVLNEAGNRVLFDCGPDPYSQEGTNLCEVGIDGKNFIRKLAATTRAEGKAAVAVRRGDYAPNGSIVFEGEWTGEQLWRFQSGNLSRLRAQDSNDNSPCVLSDGRVGSLWLGRSGGSGLHELKLTTANGSSAVVLLPNVDVADTGLSCHR